VSGLSGTCAALSFTARGYRVVTDGNTEFTKGPCKRLSNGMQIDLAGERQQSGSVYARRIELERKGFRDARAAPAVGQRCNEVPN
jgi:hypothetical protein